MNPFDPRRRPFAPRLHRRWSPVLAQASLVTAVVALLFYQWFAVANRYDIFLYFHLKAAPFDGRTVSRYRMAGLVAAGAVLVLYTLVNLVAGRLAAFTAARYAPPTWWLVWAVSALPTAALIVAITTTQNNPTLPLPLALTCAAITLAGLAPALMPGWMAAVSPLRLPWVLAAGLGVTPCLLLLRALELPSLGLSISPGFAYGMALGATAAGVCWLLLIGWAAGRWLRSPLRSGEVFVAAVCISYLLLPLAHHLFFTPPGHPYITVTDNFFAVNPLVQAACIAAAYAASSIPSLFVPRPRLP